VRTEHQAKTYRVLREMINMEQNIIERNFAVRFLLGLGVIMTMAFVGERLAIVLLEYSVPYGEWIGVAVGAIAVFITFAAMYTRFDSVYGDRL